MRDLSYVSLNDPAWKRWTMAAIEDLSGRRRYLPLYHQWRARAATNPDTMMRDMLDLIDVSLDIKGPGAWPPEISHDLPLVMIANHPYGLADGIAALALSESLQRPYRVLINKDLLKVPEIKHLALPIDFSDTREALETNLASRAEARRLVREGVTIVVFPAGGVATASNPFGRAEELPWKSFTARLIQQAKASVLPVFFEGQNSVPFHLASHFSLTLRLSLIVSEFRNFPGKPFAVHVGDIIPFERFANGHDRQALVDELYVHVHRLDPLAHGLSNDDLLTRRNNSPRLRYPWA